MGFFSRKSNSASGEGMAVTIGGAKAVAMHPNSPVAAFDDGANKFAEIYGSSMVSSTRMFVVSIVSLLLALMAVGAVLGLTPLKEVVPWVVEVNPGSGMVNKPIEVQKITPNVAVVKAELARWAEAVYTIDQMRTPELFKYANTRARDKAIGQFAEFRGRERVFERIQREQGLVREVKVSSVDASQPGIAFIFLATAERIGPGVSEAKPKRIRLTLHYQIDTPKEEATLLANPLGLYVSFFNEAEERTQ